MLTSGNYPFEQLLNSVNWLLWTPASTSTQQLPKTDFGNNGNAKNTGWNEGSELRFQVEVVKAIWFCQLSQGNGKRFPLH